VGEDATLAQTDVKFLLSTFAKFVLSLLLIHVGTTMGAEPREFPVGRLQRLDELPPGRFRANLEKLPVPAQERARVWLRSFHFTEHDLSSLHADTEGGIYYVCHFPPIAAADTETQPPVIAEAAVPISPFPTNLIFHSRPGAPNVLYINFCGETVSNTAWNTSLGRASIPALPFSTDSDYTTFSDAEQLAIKRIWQRMAEDYAPFNIDVTTERPATFTTRTAMALITRNTDANGDPNPSSTAGGVAYVNVFGTVSYATYRPAWIYHNNLSNNEGYIAEAASHEIGHNMGLSHDGKTDGTEYYSGHGTGDISWGPIMGTGYNRNVTQWCKGDYYLANNTQDDLATVAAKISYRTDDHGDTPATATALILSGLTNIVSTTPETDPANTNTANKGVLERNTDVDVFSFITGTGPVSLSVNPWISPANTRGGNLDILLELYDETGSLLLTNNPPTTTTASIQTNLTAGRYFLYVRNSGAGDPFSSTPTGYTAYGSIGQYFISGYVTDPSGVVIPPLAELTVANLTQPGQTNHTFTVTYSDNMGINVSTIDSNDILVTGPNNYAQLAQLLSVDINTNGTPRTATYSIRPPSGSVWLPADNGTYSVFIQSNQVADVEGACVAPCQLGQFQVIVPVPIYSANMDTDPGWTLEPEWQYGVPAYTTNGPTSGYTGTKIIGYNLSGNYTNNLTPKYATTPPINCSACSTLTLRFKRWLRTKNNDTASIEVSTDGTTWSNVWSTSKAVSDTSWQAVQYALPSGVAGQTAVRLRWGQASNASLNDIGWNIDDVELLGDSALDTAPPLPLLSAGNITIGGSPSYSFTVTYTDTTAVRLSSLGSNDLVVTGPNGYSNTAEFVGADLPTDGSPITATYSIPAPGGSWDSADNGTYTVTLLEGAVEDTLNNAIPQTVLGTFTVAIPPPSVSLVARANNPLWGSVSPTGGTYTVGTTTTVVATPATYFRFQQWSGDLISTNNPLTIVMTTNVTVTALFAEVMTTNYPTPYWWLAENGITNDFESAVTNLGANGRAFWQSYIAGLNPNDPNSQLRLDGQFEPSAGGFVLQWTPVTGRVYTIHVSTNLLHGFSPLPDAINLPDTVRSFTNTVGDALQRFYRLEVQKP